MLRVDLLQGRRRARREEMVLAVAGRGDPGQPGEKLLGDGGGNGEKGQDEGGERQDHTDPTGGRAWRGGGTRVIVTGVFGERHLHFVAALWSRGTVGVGGEGDIE